MKSQPRGTFITRVPILGQLFAPFGNRQGLKTGGLLLLAGLMFTTSPVNAEKERLVPMPEKRIVPMPEKRIVPMPEKKEPNKAHILKNGAHIINLKSGQIVSNINFGNTHEKQRTEIMGMKWHDINGNGKIDDGEPGLANVTIFLDLNDNGVLEENEPSKITDKQGRYIFSNLEAGTYVVREVVPAGYLQTHPPVK